MNRGDLWLRLRALLFRKRVEHELDDELKFHLDMEVRKNKARGLPEEDARQQALLKFGNVGSVAEECRDTRGVQLVDSLIRDTRYAWRQLRLSPAFTVIGILSLALGVGANTALFTVFDALYLRKISVPQPDDIVSFQWQAFGGSNAFVPRQVYGNRRSTTDDDSGLFFTASTSFSKPALEDFQRAPGIPAEVFGFASIIASADIDGYPRDTSAQVVSGNYFRALSVTAIAGRLLEPGDDVLNAPPAAVISAYAWETLFESSDTVIGKKIVLNGLPLTIVGVVQRDFQLRSRGLPAFSLPTAFADRVTQGNLARPGLWWLELMARKKPGTTIQQVEASLQGLFQGNVIAATSLTGPVVSEQIPRLVALPGSRGFVPITDGGSQEFFLTVATVFAFLLLIVCLNLANLLTARAVSREYEIGMRLSLGASRWRLIRQLVTESVLLALIGGAAGVLVSFWGREILRAYFGQQVPLEISWRVLVFNIAIAAATGLLFGIAPALRATRHSLNESAKRAARNVAQPRALLNKSLVVLQVALSVVLLIGAGLLIQSSGNWKRLDLGFDPKGLLVFDTPPADDKRGGMDLFRRMAEQIRAVPGVSGVSTAGCFPPSSCGVGGHTVGSDQTRRSDARQLDVPSTFFGTIGSSLIAGRNFTATDATADPPVTIVDEEFARRLFPGASPIGKHVVYDTNEGEREYEVIGVVKNVVLDIGREEIRPVVYFPETPAMARYGTTFVIRIAGDTETVVRGIRRAVGEVDPAFPIFGVRTYAQLKENDLSRQRQLSATWTFFGGSALLLTAVGLYGLMAYTVSRRVNEIGIRIALGATRRNVLSLVSHQILRLVVAGLALGFVLSLALNQVIQAYVFGVRLFDMWTLVSVAALVAAVTALASYPPARKGTRIDPVVALRCE